MSLEGTRTEGSNLLFATGVSAINGILFMVFFAESSSWLAAGSHVKWLNSPGANTPRHTQIVQGDEAVGIAHSSYYWNLLVFYWIPAD